MTVSTTSNANSSLSRKSFKRSISFPQSLEMIVSEQGPCKDSLLQSSNPKRRYMRRGSKCPSMLCTSFSLPSDLSTLITEYNITASIEHSNGNTQGRSITSFSSKMKSPGSTNNKRSAADLVTQAINLSSTFDGLDIDTNKV
jgi:hypothetical protein